MNLFVYEGLDHHNVYQYDVMTRQISAKITLHKDHILTSSNPLTRMSYCNCLYTTDARETDHQEFIPVQTTKNTQTKILFPAPPSCRADRKLPITLDVRIN